MIVRELSKILATINMDTNFIKYEFCGGQYEGKIR